MPTVFRSAGFRFFFYSNEGSPREPIHVHVRRDGNEAKLWLRAKVAVAYNDGLSAREVKAATQLAEENRETIEGAWNEFFS
jgi:tellurite resistance protein